MCDHFTVTQNSSDNLYQTMLEKIFHCENAMEQAFLIQKMNLEQTNRYADLLDEIGMFFTHI